MSRDRRSLIPDGDIGLAGETPERARWVLADLASRVLSKGSGLREAGLQTVRLELPVAPLDPLAWLGEQAGGPKFYWSGREDDAEVAALGAADLHEGEAPEDPAALRKRLAPLLATGDPRVRYYGGLRFDPEQDPSGEWAAFGAFRFQLPRFELGVRQGRATLACNLVLPRDAGRADEVLGEIEGLSFGRAATVPGLPRAVLRDDSPEYPEWRRNIDRSLSAFGERRLDKVVLARRAAFLFDGELDPVLLARDLKKATPGCFHFYVEPEKGAAFVGASPERLFRRSGRSIASEAIAGTRPRGDSEADDDGFRDELLRSDKDLAEHSYVRTSIREALAPLCEELEVEQSTSEMKLTSRRHLVSGVSGTLRPGVSDAELLAALHPTPAVGGYPKEEALAEIRALEAFDRGWYAGPVGWIGADAAEFAVGIRSGLVSGRNLALFSGAGIVSGSIPEEEWAEIEQKIGDFTRVLGLDPGYC